MKRPPDISISRLTLYARFLDEFVREKGAKATINSAELAQALDMNPHQIRKDLSYFGKFGARGVGYKAEELRAHICSILGLGRQWNLCLCGVGNLGTALCAYAGFRSLHLNIVAAFDSDPRKVGSTVQGIRVSALRDIRRLVRERRIDIALIAVPQEAAPRVTALFVRAGVRAILNFAPVKLTVPARVKLRTVDFSTELLNLTHFLSGSAANARGT